jgi:hypothetical protein
MSVSVDRATAHVQEWGPYLDRFRTRLGWGSSLYHACQIEVAAAILRRGQVLCRNLVPQLLCDVANQGALHNNPEAHNFVRLYFRPRNRFHVKTEGIKSRSDPNRSNPHMSIPIMLVFDLVSVLTLPQARFVAGNFANSNQELLSTDAEFGQLDFDKVYHDSGSGGDMPEIRNLQMSEVVVPERLPFDALRCVVCRTIHEERYLRWLLGPGSWNFTILVETSGSIFVRRGMSIGEIYTQGGELHFQFNSPVSSPQESYEVIVSCGKRWLRYDLKPSPAQWRIPDLINADPNAVWKVEIEGCTAFEGPVPTTGPILA